MRDFRRWGWLLAVVWLLNGCDDGVYSSTVVFDGNHHFGPATHLPGDVIIRAGSVEFAAGSRIDGSIYIVGGRLQLDGVLGGDLALLDGRVTLGPAAVVGGDLRLGNGTVEGLETAVIRGETITGLAALSLDEARNTVRGDAIARWLVGALVLAALGGLWADRRPVTLALIADTATGHWPAALALRLLALMVLPVLLVTMAFTIILIPLALLLGAALFLVLGMGIVVLGMRLGSRLAVALGLAVGAGRAAFAGTLLLMLLYALPVVGELLLGGTAVFLFGSLLLTRFGTHRYRPPSLPGSDADLSSYARPG